MTPGAAESDRGEFVPLGELAAVFLRLSLLGFGGPNAHIALMLEEVVERRRWMTREHFLELVAVTNLLPGPNSSEVAIHIGHVKRGIPGALVTGLVFLLPAFLMVTGLAALYFGPLGGFPALGSIFVFVKPVVLALIFRAAWKLGGTAIDGPLTLLLGTAGVVTGALYGGWAVPVMLLGGCVTWVRWRATRPESPEAKQSGFWLAPIVGSALPQSAAGAGLVTGLLAGGSAFGVFLLMLGIGSVLFGGGYTLVAILQPLVVDQYGWMTTAAFLDGIAITQAVPGPISTLAAFVGFAAAGPAGAIAGTAGVYLPAFVAVIAVAPFLERMRKEAAIKAILAGISAVVAGTIVGVALTLVPSAVVSVPTGVVAALTLALLISAKIGPGPLILIALAAGGVFTTFGS